MHSNLIIMLKLSYLGSDEHVEDIVRALQLHTPSQLDVQGSVGEILSPATAMATACKSPCRMYSAAG